MHAHQVAIVVGDTAGRWPLIEEITAPLVYIRLHGDEVFFPTGYTESALAGWAEKITACGKRAESVYVFCDNDYKTAAPENAAQLMKMLKIAWRPPGAPVRKSEKASAEKAGAKEALTKKAANNRTISKPKRRSSPKN
jgi:uncharacterized protein YecE (DUF72 family)